MINAVSVLLILVFFGYQALADVSFESGNSPFIPDTVLDYFSQAPDELKEKFCVGKTDVTSSITSLSKQPPKRLFGFNSKMDNGDEVEGARILDEFSLRMSQLQTTGWAMERETSQRLAFEALYQWAKSNALLETYNCRDGNNSRCAQWTQTDGQDLSASMDHSKVQMEIMHLAYAYYSTLSSYMPNDSRHAAIDKWFRAFERRNKHPSNIKELYFGLDFGWSWPAIFFGHLDNAPSYSARNAKKILKPMYLIVDISCYPLWKVGRSSIL